MSNKIQPLDPDEGSYGPAMLALQPRQRAFVSALLDQGDENYTKAAMAAGYCDGQLTPSVRVTGSRLAHDEKVQAAIREEASKRLGAYSVIATDVVLKVMQSPLSSPKDRLRAAEMIMNRSGLHPMSEHKIDITNRNVTDQSEIDRIKALAQMLGLDAKQLLGSVGVTDAEFVDVTPKAIANDSQEPDGTEGLEDVL